MRAYATIPPAFWLNEARILKKHGPETLLVAVYLQTAPGSNMCGLFYLPVHAVAHELGIPPERASQALEALQKAGFLQYDADAEMVWIFEMAKMQVPKPNAKQKKGVANQLKTLPDTKLLKAFYLKYSTTFDLEERENEDDFDPDAVPF